MGGKQQSGAEKEIRSHSTAGKGLVLAVSAPFDHQYSHFKVKDDYIPTGGSRKCPQSVELLM